MWGIARELYRLWNTYIEQDLVWCIKRFGGHFMLIIVELNEMAWNIYIYI